jgi:WD40 repeat protein/serine/threonine protein kinase
MLEENVQADLEAQLQKACAELSRRLRAGGTCDAEQLFGEFPSLRDHKDSALELIYTEFVVREQLGQNPGIEQFCSRYSAWRQDLEEMFQVHQLFNDDELRRRRFDTPRSDGRQPTVPDHFPGGSSPRGRIGNYEIIEEIGRGGMGVVCQARQLGLGRTVALKMTLSGDFASQQELARFGAEAEAAARLQHPNIVQIYEVGTHNGLPFFSLEYISDGSLQQTLAGGPLAPRVAAELAETLAQTVHYAHEQGVIHRDLKPANVLLQAIGAVGRGVLGQKDNASQRSPAAAICLSAFRPKITDFGLAKQLGDGSELTGTNQIVGTPSYMAPEQANGSRGQVGPACDVYALGAILYEMMTGRPPFRAATALETLEQLRTEEPIAPRRLHRQLPRELETICLKCLEKSPAKRYATAGQLAEDLRRFLAGEPILARPAQIWERAVKWAKRRPAVAGLIGAIALGFLGVTWQWLRAEAQRAGAELSRVAAIEAADRAEAARKAEADQRDSTERLLYFRDIALAHHEYLANNIERAVQLLDACRTDRRGWEWDYLNRLCHQEVLSLQYNDRLLALAFSPDGSRIAAGTGLWGSNEPGEVRVWDAATGDEISVIPQPTSVTGLSFSSDGKLLAASAVPWERRKQSLVTVWDMTDGSEKLSIKSVDYVYSVSFGAEAQLALGCTNGKIKIWDVNARKELLAMSGHSDAVFSLSYRSDGRRLVSGSRDGSVRLWDATDGRELATVPGIGDVRTVDFSPADQRVAVGTFGGHILMMDASGDRLRQIVRHPPAVGVFSIRFSPDGTLLAIGTRGQGVKLWDAWSGEELRVFRAHLGFATNVAFSPNGRRLASGGNDHQLKVWDLTNDPPLSQLPRSKSGTYVSCIAYSPDGERLAIGYGLKTEARARHPEGMRLIIRNGSESILFQGHSDSITSVAFTPNGRRVVTGSKDKTVRLWNASNGATVHVFAGHTGEVADVAISPDGASLATASTDYTLRIWDITAGQEMRTIDQHDDADPTCVAYTRDGQHLVSGGSDGTVRLWNATTGQPVAKWTAARQAVTSLACSLDGRFLAAASDQQIYLWPLRGDWDDSAQPIRTFSGHTDRVSSVAFSPDGQRLVSAGLDFVVRIWDVETGHEAAAFPVTTGRDSAVTFRPDGKQLALSAGVALRIWDTSDESAPALVPDVKRAAAWHRRELRKSGRDNRWFALAFHWGELSRLEPSQSKHHTNRARAFMELENLKGAASELAKAAEMTGDPVLWCRAANCYLADNQFERYREICKTLVDNYSHSPKATNSIAWTLALSPDGIDPTKLVALAERAVAHRRDFRSLNTLALALYRAGRNDEALGRLHESIEAYGADGTPYDWLVLAMVYQRQGKTSESREQLNRAMQWVETNTLDKSSGNDPDPYFTLDRRMLMRALGREVESEMN